jgi:RHS repeat-associated protein
MVSAGDLDVDQLKGMPDVKFDFGVSGDLKSAFSAAASKLEGQRDSRSGWRSSGGTDFKGYFSEVFKDNGTQQLSDLDEIASALRDVVTKVGNVEQAAREENKRRKTARDWAKSQADRNWLEKGWDSVFGGDDPPAVDISDSGPPQTAKKPTTKPRKTPAPGSGGGGSGGTSSARPSNLRTFANNSRGGDDAFSGTAGGLQNHCDDFAKSCSWATLDASGPISALKEWLRLNEEDATWATTVADAFKAAGGEGNVSTLSNATIAAALAAAHVAVNRADIQVDPATAFGSPPTTGYSDDPVNTASGNFIENESDLGFTGPASLLALTRTYNSLNNSVGGFGIGWSCWTEAGLTFTDQAARLRLGDGREIVFPRLGDGWDRAHGENLWLVRAESDNGHAPGFLVIGSTGLRWELSADGRLQSTSNGPGTVINFAYDTAGRLLSMAHQFGRSVSLEWDDATGRVIRAAASDGRQVSYQYDESGRLVAAMTPAGTRSYRWNDENLITAVVDPDGIVEAENTYDEVGRVTSQRSPFGRVSRFVYLPGGITSVSDESGERSNTWISDSKGRLIGVIDADDHRQSTSYDRYGNPVMVTERNGAVTVNSYDNRGRRVGQVLPSGARIAWSYDDQDRPVNVTVTSTDDHGGTVEAVTRYAYQGDSRDPYRMIDPEGGVTEMIWSGGLLKQVTDPVGVTVTFDHDQHGELIAATDGDGNTARLERDDLGRVTAAITPLGHRTTYRYDGAGPLLSRTDPDGAVWRYEYSPGGRRTAVIDPEGGRTEIEHDLGEHGHGLEARTVDPLGRAVRSFYDDLGNRVRAELPDGSAWEFGFDPTSRLTETRDATGGRWQLQYDVQGRVSTTIDPTGVERTIDRDVAGRPVAAGDLASRTTAGYDALGRTVTRTEADGTTSTFSYDLCGRLVQHVDPTGAVTRLERDAAGRVVAVTHPMGTTYRYEYDACGRRSATIDTDGTRYGFAYDADGRLIREHWPTGEQAWIRYDECGRAVERFEPGKGVTRFGYDRLGRMVRMADGWHGLRRFRYDQAGQLVAVTNAAGGETRFEYNELGQRVAMIDPAGGRTERRFDAMGRLLAETDALGRTTRYAYDRSGRLTRRIDPTGSELSWSYDRTGRVAESFAGGPENRRLLTRIERDFGSRTTRIHEGDGAGDAVNELVYDADGRLVRRTRARAVAGAGAIGLSWTYDADGRRTAFTRTDGTQTRYEYDAAGRVAGVTEPGLGRAVIDRDSIGRIVSMTAPGLHATWQWDGGAITRQTVTRAGVTEVTEIDRDEAGRVVGETVNGVRTGYLYDPAGQLVEMRSSDGSVTSYTYDAAGRLVRETVDGRVTTYTYDAADQLLTRRSSAGVTEFRYDAAGRRISETGPEGERRFGWDPRGFLSRITTVTHENDKVVARTRELQVDALGELADIDGQPVAWDSASGLPALAQVGQLSISNYGPLTALLPDAAGGAGGWVTPDWRHRNTGTDPWGITEAGQLAGAESPAELPSGVSIGSHANLLVDGMEWMQARVYDPLSRGFLSTDPLDPMLGAGWAGNPYSFAGNDPLNQSDPWGLKPVTDQELQAYRDSNNGALSDAWHATTSWVKNNWEYIAAGALIVGGIAVMCTGVGGPIGAAMIGGALMSGGISAATQKYTTGGVDWGKVGVDAAIGGVAGLAGGGAAVGAMRATAGVTSCLGRNMLTGAAAGMADGGVSGGLSYLTSGQPLSVNGFVEATANGAAFGGATGGLGGAALTKVSGSACFVAGTQVLMGDGSSRNIEDLTIGDEVTAADPETGETHARRVIDTYVHEDVPTYDVHTTAGVVTSTEEHPFYVEGRGWTPVRDLQPGDRLVDPKGGPVSVLGVRETGRTETVYNFTVEELHSYHVGVEAAWLLVHNECGPTMYRGMRGTADGPEPGASASTLGARPNVDIPVDGNGLVRPGTGGMSVNDSPTGMPEFRRPPSFGGSGKNLNMYGMDRNNLGPHLQYSPDPTNPGHGFVEPSREMPFDEYQGHLHGTAGSWSEVTPE